MAQALTAILLWSTLASLGAALKGVPPLLVTGLALTLSGLLGLPRAREWRVSPAVLATGVSGIFGYHFLYFLGFSIAPPVEANLINYLWPLLIVVLAPLFLPGLRLSVRHLAGALFGLCGAFLALSGGDFSRLSARAEFFPGYLAMAAAALVWATYSLLTRRLAPFPTGAVGAFCLISGPLALAAHFLTAGFPGGLEQVSALQWGILIVLGVGPMGAAFYLWDAALKRSDPRAVGALSYLTPLLSTLLLVLTGGRTFAPATLAALVLIVGGAWIGASARDPA